ncbi:MAG: NADH-quinone oxidoreductase subunit L [Thaumarchaeota archaeon]|nr:NADH-quinone oxidoreductase subunit L [Nitrososphaerota archaeon]
MVELAFPLAPWLVWAIPMFGALLIPLYAKFGDKARDYIAVIFPLLSAISAAMMLPLALNGQIFHQQIPWITSLNIKAGVLADPLGVLMANIVAWISFLIMVYSIGYMHGDTNLTRYWFFMNLFIGSMQLIVLSDNFLQLFFGWEGVGLCSYALIGFWNKDKEKDYVGTVGHTAWGFAQAYSPSHAGMKAFITTRVGDVAFLIGILTLFFYSGTFGYTELAAEHQWAVELARSGLLIPVAVLIFGGAIGKSAQFPLHEWLPDAMAGPTSVSALIHAATMVKAGVFLVARIGPLFYVAVQSAQLVAPFFQTVAWIGAITAFLAASQALVAREVKKVLAYSTVSQIGYMMLGLGVAGLSSEFVGGFVAGFFHLTSHAIFKAALFMGAGVLIHATETKYMDEMGGLKGGMKKTYFAMLVATGSLAGVPFLSGFWSKDAILASVLDVGGIMAYGLFGLATITAIMTAFYSFRMIGMIFFGKKSHHLQEMEHHGHDVREAPTVMWLPIAILAAATLTIGVTGPFFEGFLETAFAKNLKELYGMQIVEHGFALNPIAISASVLALVIGGFFGYNYYIARRSDPFRMVQSNAFLGGMHKFLENRWYIDALYYKIFVNAPITASNVLFKGLELGVLDKTNVVVSKGAIALSAISNWFDSNVVDGIANGMATVSTFVSGRVRKIQTGVANQYVFAFALGIVFLVILMLILL